MFQDKMVLCASSAYEKKFYLNENFEGLPQHVKDELKIMCVLFTEDVGGVLSLEFDENGNLELNTSADEGDLLYDEIGSVLKIKQMQQEKQELFESLETYYKVFFLGEDIEDDKGDWCQQHKYHIGYLQGREASEDLSCDHKGSENIR